MSTEPINDIAAIADASGIAAAKRVIAEALADGLRAPKTWLMAKDCAEDGPYTAPTISRFCKEGRGPRFKQCGQYLLCRREWWDAWIMRGGPDAYEKTPDGKLWPNGKPYRLKPELQKAESKKSDGSVRPGRGGRE